MLLNLLVGIPVMLLCLLMEALILVVCLRYYLRQFQRSQSRQASQTFLGDLLLLAMVMLVMTLGYLVQIAIWAALFLLLGEFDDFDTAAYYSGVTFATLGYGDIVLSPSWRLLGALEAGNGVLMLGISTAAMTAAVKEVMQRNLRRLDLPKQPKDS